MRVERGVGEDASDGRGFRMALEGQPGCTKPLLAVTDCYVVDRGTLHAPNPPPRPQPNPRPEPNPRPQPTAKPRQARCEASG